MIQLQLCCLRWDGAVICMHAVIYVSSGRIIAQPPCHFSFQLTPCWVEFITKETTTKHLSGHKTMVAIWERKYCTSLLKGKTGYEGEKDKGIKLWTVIEQYRSYNATSCVSCCWRKLINDWSYCWLINNKTNNFLMFLWLSRYYGNLWLEPILQENLLTKTVSSISNR